MALEITESPIIKNPMSNKKATAVAFTSLVLGLIVFTIAYIGMQTSAGIGSLNQPVLSWIIDHRKPSLTYLAQIITSLASPAVFAGIVLFVAIVWLFAKKELWRPLLLVASVGVAAITSFILKNTTMYARPNQIDMVPTFETSFSFPSGHTIGMVVFMLVFGYVIYSRNYSTLKLWFWAIAAMIGTSLIAASRLYLGYHWLTDVVASIGLGFIILAIVIFIDLMYIKHFN